MLKTGGKPRLSRDFLLFLAAGALLGFYQGLYDPIFNNYLNDVFRIGEAVRGALEFPREFPGFAVVFISGLLFFLADTRLAVLAVAVMAAGLLGQGLLAPTVGWMMVWMVAWSIGSHLYMPLSSSIGVALAEKHAVGKRLGQLAGAATLASLAGYGLVWVGFRHLGMGYREGFVVAGAAALAAAACLWLMRPRRGVRRPALVFKRCYGLFYILNVLFGARKQVFLTFGPWVLIRVFHQPVTTFAVLGLAGTALGVFFKPALGRAIDLFGERRIIVAESLILVMICLGYGYARHLGLGALAVYLVYACFIIDQLLFAVNMARATYLSKIAEVPEDITPTLSMGVSLDHAVSMTVPILGGLVWEWLGFEYVFLGAALIALVNFAAALRIRTGEEAVPAVGAAARRA